MEIRVFRKLKRPPQKPPVALTQADTMTSRDTNTDEHC